MYLARNTVRSFGRLFLLPLGFISLAGAVRAAAQSTPAASTSEVENVRVTDASSGLPFQAESSIVVDSQARIFAGWKEMNDIGGAQPALLALRHRRMDAVVKMAVFEAYRRLEDPRCREIFSDFSDSSGRSLQQNLDSIDQTGQSYLAWMYFSNADSKGRCEDRDVLAFMSPGSRVVFFCGKRFLRKLKQGRLGSLAVLILHEELHSLGLGEDPPTTGEITRGVESRCGS